MPTVVCVQCPVNLIECGLYDVIEGGFWPSNPSLSKGKTQTHFIQQEIIK